MTVQLTEDLNLPLNSWNLKKCQKNFSYSKGCYKNYDLALKMWNILRGQDITQKTFFSYYFNTYLLLKKGVLLQTIYIVPLFFLPFCHTSSHWYLLIRFYKVCKDLIIPVRYYIFFVFTQWDTITYLLWWVRCIN